MSANPSSPGQPRQLTRLWMEAQPSVLSLICAAIPRFHDAEDVLQETAIEAADNFGKYDDSRPFIAWVIGIARFKIAAFYRKHNRERCLLSENSRNTEYQFATERHQPGSLGDSNLSRLHFRPD